MISGLTNRKIGFHIDDICQSDNLTKFLSNNAPDVVLHFAGLKAVGESVTDPLKYYLNNVTGTINLLRAMDSCGCQSVIFSSSATVYGNAQYQPLDEHHPISPTNPYGRTKATVEQIIEDWTRADVGRSGICLRYFNPVGAHDSGLIGEDPLGVPNNLFPILLQVATGHSDRLNVFGNDFPTRDGTGERDYVHVTDLAAGHVKALEFALENTGFETFNLGTGSGSTVLEVIRCFEDATGVAIPFQIGPRRAGDVASSVADPSKARRILGWRAERSLGQACLSSYNWQKRNPTGYEGQ
tara:strand:+ start:1482 stop:2372 length:891 start_codon:yes stop_codon:yes gene_type:complete